MTIQEWSKAKQANVKKRILLSPITALFGKRYKFAKQSEHSQYATVRHSASLELENSIYNNWCENSSGEDGWALTQAVSCKKSIDLLCSNILIV